MLTHQLFKCALSPQCQPTPGLKSLLANHHPTNQPSIHISILPSWYVSKAKRGLLRFRKQQQHHRHRLISSQGLRFRRPAVVTLFCQSSNLRAASSSRFSVESQSAPAERDLQASQSASSGSAASGNLLRLVSSIGTVSTGMSSHSILSV